LAAPDNEPLFRGGRGIDAFVGKAELVEQRGEARFAGKQVRMAPPMRPDRSKTRTRWPPCTRRCAAVRPVTPAPRTAMDLVAGMVGRKSANRAKAKSNRRDDRMSRGFPPEPG
jgi:hypothetical protein